MTSEEQTVLMIHGLISELAISEQIACNKLVVTMRQQIKEAGEPVGTLALALIGAEAQQAAS